MQLKDTKRLGLQYKRCTIPVMVDFTKDARGIVIFDYPGKEVTSIKIAGKIYPLRAPVGWVSKDNMGEGIPPEVARVARDLIAGKPMVSKIIQVQVSQELTFTLGGDNVVSVYSKGAILGWVSPDPERRSSLPPEIVAAARQFISEEVKDTDVRQDSKQLSPKGKNKARGKPAKVSNARGHSVANSARSGKKRSAKS